MLLWGFRALVVGHLITGTIGLVLFWVAVATRKGAPTHKRWGMIFVRALLVTGCLALAMSTLTLVSVYGTHPDFAHHPVWKDATLTRALFGWMMQYLAILTLSLTWHGWRVVVNKKAHAQDRHWFAVALQLLVIVAAVNVLARGIAIAQPTMIGISVVGFASGGTNLWYAFRPAPKLFAYQYEHAKGLVGAAISAYTAFLAFGLVRAMPDHAFNPVIWAMPCVVGLCIIAWHQVRIARMRTRALAAQQARTGDARLGATAPDAALGT